MDWLLIDVLGKPAWMWAVFLASVLLLVLFDLGVLHKKGEEIGVRQSLRLSGFYIGAACLFGLWLWYELGSHSAMLYFTGFFIEKSLSLDNIFVISLIFSFFAIPRAFQHRVLFWGILGVLFLRGVMIVVGAQVVANYAWTLQVFAAFLIFTGIKMLMPEGEEKDLADSKIIAFLRRVMRVTPNLHEEKFFVRAPNPSNPTQMVWWATPLFLTLCMVELSDVIFAVDSVPAIFSITSDPFIVFTSNIFAILGLRALYFALSAMVDRFHYLKYALAMVLVFIGSKVFIAEYMLDGHIPPALSLFVTFGTLAAGVFYSMYKTRQEIPRTFS
ncbi:MAG: TerC family protein [Burkholderiales bacterium]|nr:TerC family protein [Burkholderiales bacterium]